MMKAELQGNVDQLNKLFKNLVRTFPEVGDRAIMKTAHGVYRDMVEGTPVDTGTTRHHWTPPRRVHRFLWEFGNDAPWILRLEYGIFGLSEDPEKRKKQLRYLFATGKLISVDGEVRLGYTPRPKNYVGWMRRTLKKWRDKEALQVIKKELTDWIIKRSKELGL